MRLAAGWARGYGMICFSRGHIHPFWSGLVIRCPTPVSLTRRRRGRGLAGVRGARAGRVVDRAWGVDSATSWSRAGLGPGVAAWAMAERGTTRWASTSSSRACDEAFDAGFGTDAVGDLLPRLDIAFGEAVEQLDHGVSPGSAVESTVENSSRWDTTCVRLDLFPGRGLHRAWSAQNWMISLDITSMEASQCPTS